MCVKHIILFLHLNSIIQTVRHIKHILLPSEIVQTILNIECCHYLPKIIPKQTGSGFYYFLSDRSTVLKFPCNI